MARPKAPCGTYPAYRRHLREREEVDANCRAAQVRYSAEQKTSRPSEVEIVAPTARVSFGPASSHSLGSRGLAYFDSVMRGADDVPAAREALVVEAARMADRLEKLNEIIAGRGVVELLRFRLKEPVNEAGVVTVEMTIDHVMGEARQLQLAFEKLTKTVIADFELQSSAGGADPFDTFLAGGNVVGITSASSRKQA